MEQTRLQWVLARFEHLASLERQGKLTEAQRYEIDGLRMELQECFGIIR